MSVDSTPSRTESSCPRCGYDVRASMNWRTKTVRCPECGCTSPFWFVREGAYSRFLIRVVLISMLPVPIAAALILTLKFVFNLDLNTNEFIVSVLGPIPFVVAVITVCTVFVLGFRRSDSNHLLGRIAYGGLLLLITGVIIYVQIMLVAVIFVGTGLLQFAG